MTTCPRTTTQKLRPTRRPHPAPKHPAQFAPDAADMPIWRGRSGRAGSFGRVAFGALGTDHSPRCRIPAHLPLAVDTAWLKWASAWVPSRSSRVRVGSPLSARSPWWQYSPPSLPEGPTHAVARPASVTHPSPQPDRAGHDRFGSCRQRGTNRSTGSHDAAHSGGRLLHSRDRWICWHD